MLGQIWMKYACQNRQRGGAGSEGGLETKQMVADGSCAFPVSSTTTMGTRNTRASLRATTLCGCHRVQATVIHNRWYRSTLEARGRDLLKGPGEEACKSTPRPQSCPDTFVHVGWRRREWLGMAPESCPALSC